MCGLTLLGSELYGQNAVILGDAYLYGGHAESSVWIQGDVSGSNYEVYKGVNDMAFYLGGDNKMSNFFRVNNGYADIRGKEGKYQGQTGDIPTPNWASYIHTAEYLATFAGQSLDTSAHNNIRTEISDGLNIFSLNSSQLSGYKTLDFQGGEGVVVMNVTGDLDSWGWSVNYDPSKIIWNFIDAENVNINNRSITGSVLAPNATVTQKQNIDGFLLAGKWKVYNSVELHDFGMPRIEVTPIPEASVSLFTALAALLGLTRRRR
ncbi:MAG: collagen-binding domain-containing protein [Verrucomicrobiales bacterium]